jgi:Secretion system C-terminal sorting domain
MIKKFESPFNQGNNLSNQQTIRRNTMKGIQTVLLVAAVTMLFAAPEHLLSQTSGDTLYVSALPPGNLNTVITGDTTAAGLRNDPNRVYVLQQTAAVDTPYYLSATITANYNLTIIGKPNPVTGNLPVIGRFILGDNSSPHNFVQTSANVTFKNLDFCGLRNDGSIYIYSVVHTTADSITIIADHCVFDFSGAVFDLYGNSNKDFITNCEFRNNCERGFQGTTGVVAENGVTIDTAEFINNTFYCWGKDILQSTTYVGYLLVDHNTCMFSSSLALEDEQATNAVIKNNIFYAVGVHGADSTEMKAGTFNIFNEEMGTLRFDTLTTLLNPPYNSTEAGRSVVVENNVYFWPQACYDYWKAVSDTAHDPGLLTPPKWMDTQVAAMFNNKTLWPGFVAIDNDSVDPGFNSSWVTTALDSLISFVNITWVSGKATYLWSPVLDDPANIFATIPQNWASTQGYPVPENLRYTNTALQFAGTDGKALGDLNWFPEQISSAPPAVPVLASPNGTTNVSRIGPLTWDKSMGATSYTVQIATDSAFSSVVLDTTVADTTITLATPLASTTKYYWHVKASNSIFSSAYSAANSFTTGTSTTSVAETGSFPKEFALFQNYPNPFNPSTSIRYDLPKAQTVTLKVYNVLGQEVATLVNSRQNAGYYEVNFNAENVSSGVYFYVLNTESFHSVQKMLLLK